MMMYTGGGFFWIFPLAGFSIFLIMLFLRGRHSSSGYTHRRREQEKKPVQREVPEEIKKAGVDLLEKLDWEIRFLEKEHLETDDSVETARIERELKEKKADYKAVVDRLNL